MTQAAEFNASKSGQPRAASAADSSAQTEARLAQLSWKTKLAFSLLPALLLLLALGGVELFLRHKGFRYSAPPEFGLVWANESDVWDARVHIDRNTLYRFAPRDDRTEKEATEIIGLYDFRINEKGYRGEDFPEKKSDPNSARILFYGDSVIFGVCAPERLTIPALLGEKLRERGLNVETLNLALPSYTSAQNLWDFEARGLGYDPDIIVLHLGSWNDLSAPLNSKTDFEVRRDFRRLVSRRESWLRKFRLVQALDHWADHRYREKLDRRPPVPQLGDWVLRYSGESLPRRAPLEDLKKITQRFLDLAEERHLGVLILIPAEPDRTWKYLDHALQPRHDYLRSLPQSDRVKVVKLQPIVDAAGRESCFFDFCHYTVSGSRSVAEGLAEPLAELVRNVRPRAVQER
jgi:lysophospholipase L1-like esterase